MVVESVAKSQGVGRVQKGQRTTARIMVVESVAKSQAVARVQKGQRTTAPTMEGAFVVRPSAVLHYRSLRWQDIKTL
jgi:hypothetical protein